MKANAPEKIYIEVTTDGTRYYRDVVKEQRTENSDIEYTLTDAFIEKACAWLTKHAKKYYFNKERYLGTEELVEDFKLSMEM